MRYIFKGYIKKSQHEIDSLWQKGLITFDANVLLNFYRYSEETRKELLELINKFQGRIFLTHQAGLEFHRNRLEVIADQEKTYSDFENQLKKIEDLLESTVGHPYIHKDLGKRLKELFTDIYADIAHRKKYYGDLVKKDDLYEDIELLFMENVTEGFGESDLNKILETAKQRYELKIPPGFEDSKTKDEPKRYGDYILWKQVLNKAVATNQSIIFVTAEQKQDWWWKLKNGKTVGPRQELVEEMQKIAGVDFHMYSIENFITFGSDYLNTSTSKETLDEISGLEISPKNYRSLLDVLKEKFGDSYHIHELKEGNLFDEYYDPALDSLNFHRNRDAAFDEVIEQAARTTKNAEELLDIVVKKFFTTSRNYLRWRVEVFLQGNRKFGV